MTHDYKPARVAGPFGYTPRDLSARTPEERDTLRRELDALDNKLQWGYEPGRWAKGAAWHDDDWPEPNLLGRGELAGGFDSRDDLIAEAGDFRATLDGADKAWKKQAGLNSPFLPALAAWPQHRREQMRERSKAIRDLVAFGETPERWARGIEFMRDDLRDPQADTGRLVALHGQRHDLLPALDTMDHALDYLDAAEAEGGADSPNAPPPGNDSGGYTPLPEPGFTGPRANGTHGIPGIVTGHEPPDGGYPPEGWAVPMPDFKLPEYPRPPGTPSTPWSRFAEQWRRRWASLGPVYPPPVADDPGKRPWWDDSVPLDDLVALEVDRRSSDSSAPAQPAGGSADGSPAGGDDGSALTGPGGDGTTVSGTETGANNNTARSGTSNSPPEPPRPGAELPNRSASPAETTTKSPRKGDTPREMDKVETYLEELDAFGGLGKPAPYAIPPTVNDGAHRIAYILNDQPAVFDVTDNPEADASDPAYLPLVSETSRRVVVDNTEAIDRLAAVQGVDPELIKAIMYREQAGGPVQEAADWTRLSGSILPMNINLEIWEGLGIDRETAYKDKEANIRAGITLVRRIQDRLADPTPEKIATLYNSIMKEQVTDYGARVARYYREKPWLKTQGLFSEPGAMP